MELIEKIESHDNLNPKLWNEDHSLKEDVRDKLEEIVDEFILELEENKIPIKVLDVHLVGSNASFNYTENSDLDVHIIANFEEVTCDPEILNLLYNFFKSYFNDKYDILIRGISVELYIEDMNASAISNGIYSLYEDKWIKFPEKLDIPDIDISDEFEEWEDRYQLIISNNDSEAAEDLIDGLYRLRKNSIAAEGEYGKGNLVFKEFRNLGYLDKLKELRDQGTSRKLSLEALKEVVMLEGRDAPLCHGTQISKCVMNESKEDNNIENIEKYIKNNFNISTHTIGGPFYILSNGSYLNLGRGGSHLGLDDELYQNGIIEQDPFDYSYLYPNTIMVDLFNAIRCNDGENLGDDEYGNPYIQLPKNLPTNAQLESLDDWIYSLGYNGKLFVDGVEYNLSEVSSEYIIKKIKRYYASGYLYEKFLLESLGENLNNVDKDKIINAVESRYSTSDWPFDGPTFLLPDGKFLDLVGTFGEDSFEDFPCHAEVEAYLDSLGLSASYVEASGCPTLQSLGAIRLNNLDDNNFIELSSRKPTEAQYEGLERWFDENSQDHNSVYVAVSGFNRYVTYNYSDYIVDDIIKRIKRYYSSGQLYESSNEDNESQLEVSSAYMLSNRGELLQCGLVHPYIKYIVQSGDKKEIESLFNSRLNDLLWFYKNTKDDKLKGDIDTLVNSVISNDTYGIDEEIRQQCSREFNLETDNKIPYVEIIENLFLEINNKCNQEFCRVRTSHMKAPIGNSGDIYFRIGSVGFNWFNIIWKIVYDNRSFVESVSICTDTQSTGKPVQFYTWGGNVINRMPTQDFIKLPGNPIIESGNGPLDMLKRGYSLNEALGDISSIHINRCVEILRRNQFDNKLFDLKEPRDLEEGKTKEKNPVPGVEEHLLEIKPPIPEGRREKIKPGKILECEEGAKLQESKNHMDIEEMIEQAYYRHPKPEEIFEEPWDELVDPKQFYSDLTRGASPEYKARARRQILMNDEKNVFYNVLLGYLDSLGTGNTDYMKLEPAIAKKIDGKIVPQDGGHRAVLCKMLGMKLPVKFVETYQESVDRTVYNALYAFPKYVEKYGKGSALFELKYKYNLQDDELVWVINKLIDSGRIDMFTRDSYISQLGLEDYEEDIKKVIEEDYLDDEEKGDWGYHYGDLGKADYRRQFGRRGTGGFGTGTYFVGTPISQRKDGGSYKNRPEHKVDFSKYKLFKPRSNAQAYKLHDSLLFFNNLGSDFKGIPATWEEILDENEKVNNEVFAEIRALDDPEDVSTPVNIRKEPLLKYIRKYIEYYPYKIEDVDYYSLKEIEKYIRNARIEESDRFYRAVSSLRSALDYSVSEERLLSVIDSALKTNSEIAPSTLIMQKLGYEGIDVRHLNKDADGLSGLDNFGYGSVIYDLKESLGNPLETSDSL